MNRIALIILSLQAFFFHVHCQSAKLDSLLKASLKTMSFVNDRLEGPAFDWITTKAEESSFLLFGESHAVAEVPQVINATYQQLYEKGYHYLALEMGPWVAQKLGQAKYRGKRGQIRKQIIQNSSSIAFSYDEEITMLSNIGSKFEARGQVFWGLDNSFGGLHLLKRLKELSKNKNGHRQVLQLIKKAKKFKDGHDFLANASHIASIQEIRKQLEPDQDSEMADLLDLLEISNRIFYNYRLAYHIKKDGMKAYENRKEREEFMKQQFLHQYRQVQALGVDQPKVIFKFGGAHVEPGIAPNLVPTLGNFVREFAIMQGTNAVNIAILCYNEKNCNQLKNPATAPLAAFVENEIGLYDFSILKDNIAKGELVDINEELKRWILRYDALIMIPNSHKAGITVIARAKIRQFFLKNWLKIGLGLGLLAGAVWLIKRRRS